LPLRLKVAGVSVEGVTVFLQRPDVHLSIIV
jgi:hypothetical protein